MLLECLRIRISEFDGKALSRQLTVVFVDEQLCTCRRGLRVSHIGCNSVYMPSYFLSSFRRRELYGSPFPWHTQCRRQQYQLPQRSRLSDLATTEALLRARKRILDEASMIQIPQVHKSIGSNLSEQIHPPRYH